MAESANERPGTAWLSMQVPDELKLSLERDAASLGISVSAAARLRLRSGRVPAMSDALPKDAA
jgi:hypothetical protein